MAPRGYPVLLRYGLLISMLALVSACASLQKKGPPPGCKMMDCNDLFEGMKPLDPNGDDDRDGIRNGVDKAPLLAEDKDGVEDDDGIPDPDEKGEEPPKKGKISSRKVSDVDKDGIADAYDLCYDRAEDRDGFEDDDGCPDLDNDQDGTPDDKDPCPNVPGTFCTPDKAMRKLEIEAELGFTPKTSKIDAVKSKAALNDVLSELMAEPAMKIEIRGYTDETGDEDGDKKLSQQRAEVVKGQLVKLGINGNRMVVVGGGTSPSRVEFFVLP